MSLDPKTRKQVEQLLLARDDRGVTGARLLDDANRLCATVGKWLDQHLITLPDPAPLQLCCYAIHLPMKRLSLLSVGKLGQISLQTRSEQAAEEMVSELDGKTDESLLDRATQVLHDLPLRKPKLDEARLLADAVNLEDFGVIGLLHQTCVLAAHGQGLDQLLQGAEKRDDYGYFEARLKDGFHFGPLREAARRRLARGRQVIELLKQELAEGKT